MRTLSALAFLALLSSLPLQAQTVTIAPSEKGARIEIDGKLFTEYMTKGTQRPCFYPVLGANDAEVTRPYPLKEGSKEDHPHHSSIWIGHGGVNGTDFWMNGSDKGKIETTDLVVQAAVVGTADHVSFDTSSKWVKPNGDVVLTDKRHFIITALADGTRQLDITVAFTAPNGDATFEDTKEGTMAIRVAPTMALKGGTGHILTGEGIKDAKAWGTQANWVAYYGPDPKGETVTLTMMDGPGNLRHPTWWHVRDYGLFAANPFGQHDFEKDKNNKTKGNYVLAKGTSFTQHYRILIQKGEPDVAGLNAAYKAFAEAK
ncbi:MAG: hypothetical protein JWO94_1537 [Verrucomicrobiaceae bacterium]|nr:hypothetical protein [Verrucomicrobiaceae bacterium]